MNVRKTITTIFMVPTLKVPTNALKDNGIINGYIKDVDRDVEYPNCIYLLFKPDDMDKFRNFLESEHERTNDIVEDYDYDGGYVVVVYKLNPKFEKDFVIVKEGKYSKTSQEFQNLFPKAVKIVTNGLHRDEISLQIRVFKKTEDLREFWEEKLGVDFDEEQEVWEGWDEEKEILNINKLKEEYVQQ
jgi:hypothetical protein